MALETGNSCTSLRYLPCFSCPLWKGVSFFTHGALSIAGYEEFIAQGTRVLVSMYWQCTPRYCQERLDIPREWHTSQCVCLYLYVLTSKVTWTWSYNSGHVKLAGPLTWCIRASFCALAGYLITLPMHSPTYCYSVPTSEAISSEVGLEVWIAKRL